MTMTDLWLHGLNQEQASRAFMALLGWSLCLQTLEYWVIERRDHIMRWDVQWHETPDYPGFLRPLLRGLFQPRAYQAMLVLRLALSLALLGGLHGLWLSAPLMLMAVLLLFRWRGAFNGGSDFMTLMALISLLIADLLSPWWGHVTAWRAALWWLSLQLITSYFMSGWVKLKHQGWRNGSTLPLFLDTGIYGPLPSNSLLRQAWVTRAVSWAFILWEGLFAFVYLDIRLAWMACAIGTLFHFMVFWYFGLNRFFWSWLVTYPALLYTVSEVGLSLM